MIRGMLGSGNIGGVEVADDELWSILTLPLASAVPDGFR